jgi:hypothetical protein
MLIHTWNGEKLKPSWEGTYQMLLPRWQYILLRKDGHITSKQNKLPRRNDGAMSSSPSDRKVTLKIL